MNGTTPRSGGHELEKCLGSMGSGHELVNGALALFGGHELVNGALVLFGGHELEKADPWSCGQELLNGASVFLS